MATEESALQKTALQESVSQRSLSPRSMLREFPWDERYKLSAIEDVITPALLIYPEIIAANLDRTLSLLDGHAQRWRAHIKTAKLAYTLRMMLERGIRNFKCATTLELLVACQCGAPDVLLAYPVVGANARRVREIAEQFPNVRISVLAENGAQVRQWHASHVGIFIDINPGMNRTGIEQTRTSEIVELVRDIAAAGVEFRGLHFYDGQYGAVEEPERTAAAHDGYARLLNIVSEIEGCSGDPVPEVVTAGTATFPCSLSFARFRNASFVHRISPGTIVYCDATSLAQLPKSYGYQAAVLVLTRVVSHPRPGIVTCDAGHKTVSADAGVPTCVVVGHPELYPLSPSEEHLPMSVESMSVEPTAVKEAVAIEEGAAVAGGTAVTEGAAVAEGAASPQTGDALYLLPRHVCPTVNNFDDALIIRNGAIESVEKVSARGREAPLLSTAEKASALPG